MKLNFLIEKIKISLLLQLQNYKEKLTQLILRIKVIDLLFLEVTLLLEYLNLVLWLDKDLFIYL